MRVGESGPAVANVIGLGLIGGSVALGLSARGWRVHGEDTDPQRIEAARRRGAISAELLAPDAAVTFVATPLAGIADAAKRALEATTGLVTDVGSVKRTPTADTADETFAGVARIVSDLGAEVVALPPDRHDALVAVVSHVPHLAAAALMTLADERAEEHAALLRLAAGGFRDMTRIAGGQPGIWLDICAENRPAIVEALDELLQRLGRLRRTVADDDREVLYAELSRARQARVNLPRRVAQGAEMAEIRTVIPDRPGAAAEVFTLAAELGVNVSDFEVFHSAEGERGVLVLLVEATQSDLFRGGLMARGYRPSVRRLG
jgi:prephenate dehydrogenase